MHLEVPATLANLGSGLDALGVALGLYLEVRAQPAPEELIYRGEGTVDPQDNLIHQAYRAAWAFLGQDPPSLALEVRNPIPLARGLGSSAAARIAGVALADRLSGGALGREGVFRLAAHLEGHPDNVAPAVFGGFAIGLLDPPLAFRFAAPRLTFALAVPDWELPTQRARAVLPSQVAREDAIFNLARSALWPAALASGFWSALPEAARDRLHQPYRAALIPGLEPALKRSIEEGVLAAFLAGAGPTLALLLGPEGVAKVLPILREYAGVRGRVILAGVSAEGYRWKEP
jgi:homoserine kinase